MIREAYDQIKDRWNWSLIRHMADSPAHVQYARTHPQEDTAAMLLGRAVHCACLEPDTFGSRFAVYEGAVRRGKEWDAFREAHADSEIIKADEWEQAQEIAEAVRAHPIAARALSQGQAEVTLQWTDPGTGLACKGRADWIGSGMLIDLKTSKSLDLREFTRSIATYDYAAQLAMYLDGARNMGMEIDAVGIIGVESSPPYDVGVFELDAGTLELGRMKYQGLLRKVAECLESGQWPGRYPEIVTIDLPTWKKNEPL